MELTSALELRNEKVDVNTGNDGECHPQETDLSAKTGVLWVLDVWGYKSNGETDTETRPGSDGESLFSKWVRRDFSGDGPSLSAAECS